MIDEVAEGKEEVSIIKIEPTRTGRRARVPAKDISVEKARKLRRKGFSVVNDSTQGEPKTVLVEKETDGSK